SRTPESNVAIDSGASSYVKVLPTASVTSILEVVSSSVDPSPEASFLLSSPSLQAVNKTNTMTHKNGIHNFLNLFHPLLLSLTSIFTSLINPNRNRIQSCF